MSPTLANAPAIIIDWLRSKYAAQDENLVMGVVMTATVPPSRTGSSGPLVVVRRSGGVVDLIRDRARIDFLHWHSTEYKATGLAAITRALVLYDLPGLVLSGHTVYQTSEVAGPALYPDPAGSSLPIVMFTVEVPIRIN